MLLLRSWVILFDHFLDDMDLKLHKQTEMHRPRTNGERLILAIVHAIMNIMARTVRFQRLFQV